MDGQGGKDQISKPLEGVAFISEMNRALLKNFEQGSDEIRLEC